MYDNCKQIRGFSVYSVCLNEYVPRLLQDPPGHQGGSRKSGHVRNLARFPHFTAQLAQYRAASGRDQTPCTLGERPTATHLELAYLVAYFIASRQCVSMYYWNVHSSQIIAVTGRERGRGTIILHGRRSTSCCPLSGKETVRTAEPYFELWNVSAGRAMDQWGEPRHKKHPKYEDFM